MKIKRYIASALACVFCCAALTGTAAAHTGDVFGGGYIGRSDAKFVLRINNSAQNDVLDYLNVYQYCDAWNNISSNVNFGIVFASGGVPTISNQLNVYGVEILNKSGGLTLGRAVPFDKNNNRLGEDNDGDGYSDTNINVDWFYSIVEMNVSDTAMSYYTNNGSKGREMLKLVFIHELGHILKLAHPVSSPADNGDTYEGHIYNGYPKAIMNKGSLVGQPCMSYTVTDHDRSCLFAKWGK